MFIFQSNPTVFQVREYMQSLPEFPQAGPALPFA